MAQKKSNSIKTEKRKELKRCPHCGACLECGHVPFQPSFPQPNYPYYPYWFYPYYWQPYQITWTTSNIENNSLESVSIPSFSIPSPFSTSLSDDNTWTNNS